MTIETKLETIDQLAIGVRVFFWQCAAILALLFNYSNHAWFQLVWLIGFNTIHKTQFSLYLRTHCNSSETTGGTDI